VLLLATAREEELADADALRRALAELRGEGPRFDAESGEAQYREALALAEPRGMRPLVAHCHLGLGKLYGRMGRREQAREHLGSATTMFREMDMPFWLEKAEKAEKAEAALRQAASPSAGA
jgi:hypothetical protein